MLSAHGRCRRCDHRADGIALSEGVAVVVIKPLATAIRDGDHVYGVIRGSGINQDGKTNGITAPSAVSQAELLRDVYRRAEVNPEHNDYVEAHGTGTLLGDPVEVRGLTEAFRSFTDKRQFCALGSVKSNVGHTSFAAGLVGVIKVLLAFKNQQIPPSINFDKPNEEIAFETTPFFVNTVVRDWPRRERRPRLAAVSSFGYSGTNAHVLLQEFVTENLSEKTADEQASQAILLSGKTAEALVQRAARLHSYIAGQSQGSNQLQRHSLVELAYTLQVGRDPMDERLAFVASDFPDIEEKLAAFLEGIGVSGGYRAAIFHRLCRARANSSEETLDGLARAWAQGEEVDWASRFGELRPKRLSLPGYPFARDRCWIQSANNEGILPAPSSEGRRELLSQLQQSQRRVGPD